MGAVQGNKSNGVRTLTEKIEEGYDEEGKFAFLFHINCGILPFNTDRKCYDCIHDIRHVR